jgi:hypothetical protein
LDRLLVELRAIYQRIAPSAAAPADEWQTAGSLSERSISSPAWLGPRLLHGWHSPGASRWSGASAPTGWAAPPRQDRRATAASGQALRHLRVTRRLLVDGQVVREDVAEAEVPFGLDEAAAVAAVEAQLPPYRPDELPPSSAIAPPDARSA